MSFLSWARAGTLICTLFSVPAFAADLSPVGQWEVTTGESRYRVTRCGKAGDELCAKLTWLRDDARTDENIALLNKTVVRGAPADVNEWHGTAVYDGQEFDATVTLVSKNSMRVHSCSGMFCKSFELSRL